MNLKGFYSADLWPSKCGLKVSSTLAFYVLRCDNFPFRSEVSWDLESMFLVSRLWAVLPYMANRSETQK